MLTSCVSQGLPSCTDDEPSVTTAAAGSNNCMLQPPIPGPACTGSIVDDSTDEAAAAADDGGGFGLEYGAAAAAADRGGILGPSIVRAAGVPHSASTLTVVNAGLDTEVSNYTGDDAKAALALIGSHSAGGLLVPGLAAADAEKAGVWGEEAGAVGLEAAEEVSGSGKGGG